MIINAQNIFYPLLMILSNEGDNHSDYYKPYTVSSMTDSNNLDFYENFWSSLIKENEISE